MIYNPKKRVFYILFLFLIQLGLKAQTTSSIYTFNLNQGENTSGLVRSSTGDFYFIKNGLTIEKLSANGTVSTFATVSGTPSNLAIDSNDNLYFIRLSSMTIRKVSPQGITTTHASLSSSIFNARRFSSLKCDSSGNLYFLVDNSAIYRCSSTTFKTSMIYSGSYISELAIDNQSNTYFSDLYTIKKINYGTYNPEIYLDSNYYFGSMVFDNERNLYFVDNSSSTGRIIKVPYNGSAQEYITNDSNLNFASRIIVDSSGVLYYYDTKYDDYGGQVQQLIKVVTGCSKPSAPLVSDQSFEDGATVANLVVIGNNIKWYTAATGGDAMISSTTLISRIYYVTQTVNDCESNRVPVIVTITKMGLSTYGEITSNESSKVNKNGAINTIGFVNKYGKRYKKIVAGNGELHYETFSASAGNPNNSNEFSSYVNPANVVSSGSASGSVLLNWESAATLTTAGIAIPDGGEQFAVQVSGYFIPQENGIYTFTCEGDDAVDLFINDVNVANHYGLHGAGMSSLGSHTGTIELIAGQSYTFRARMQDYYGGEGLRVFWRKPSESSGWNINTNELSSTN